MHKNELRFDAPCTLDWQKMTPAEGGRFSGDCKKVVRDLSKMTEGEAPAPDAPPRTRRPRSNEMCHVCRTRDRRAAGAHVRRSRKAWKTTVACGLREGNGMNKGDVRFSNPCRVDWRTMTPADGGRFCGDCKKVVRDLSKLTESEARAVLAKSRNEDLCVRFAFDAHGKILFRDMQGVGLLPPTLLSRAKRAAVAAAAIAAPLATQACSVTSAITGHSDSAESTDHEDPSSDNTSTGGVAYDPSYDHQDASSDDAATDASADAQPSDDAAADAGPDAPAHN